MRDFRDAKAMAQTIRAALAAKGVKLSVGESLELVAKAFGAADWNTLSAAIRAARSGPESPTSATPAAGPTNEVLERLVRAALSTTDWEALLAKIGSGAAPPQSPPPKPPPRATERPLRSGLTKFTATLEATLHRAVALAQSRRHSYTTLEHLLLALIDDADASAVLDACRVDSALLKAKLTRYVDQELLTLVAEDGGEPAPTAGFHRVVQRAVIHVQSSGRGDVTGANILVAIFSEQESRACFFLGEEGLTRFDAVNFIAHGVRKGDAAA